MAQAQQRLIGMAANTANQAEKEASTILLNRNLFSSYYLGTLFDKAVRAHQGETGMRMPRSVRYRLQNRWDKYTPTLGNLSSYRHTREAWLETLFETLGYRLLEANAEDFQEKTLPDGYFLYHPAQDQDVNGSNSVDDLTPDLEAALISADESEPADTPKDHAVLISLLSWGADFDRPFTSHARRGDMPHKLMERLLASGGPARWGILCNGRRIRLLKRDVVAGRQHYFEVDLEALFDNRNEQDAQRKEQGFDTFWTLFRAKAFQPEANGRCLLDVLDEESRKHAEGVSSRLKTSVFRAIEQLMSALVSRADELLKLPPTDDAREQRRRALAQEALDDLQALYTQSLVFLYRLLFVLYAESRDLLPADNAIYRDSYSFDPLRQEIELPGAEQRYQPDAFRLWETLQALFRMIHRGCNTTQLVVPAYNGNLFDPRSTNFLQAIRVPDDTLYHVLLQLSVTPPTKERGQERIDYRDLGVEQLGSVYEGLLEFEPRVAVEPMVEVRYKDVRVIIPEREKREYKVERTFQPGAFYLGRGAGRKTSGSYYTPQPLVDFLVRRTLEPLVQPHIQNGIPEHILELKVVDPAMGSGAFLVGACLYLADAYARAVRREEQLLNGNHTSSEAQLPDNSSTLQSASPLQDGVETSADIAAAAEEAAEIAVATAQEEGELSEEATRPYRRLVAERCLYGVDLNPMAVELAKVSLWLTTLAGDKPLTFLDANLRCGNSLIGAPLRPYSGTSGRTYTIEQMHPEANKRLLKMRGAKAANKKGEEDARQLTLFEQDELPHQLEPLVNRRVLIAETPSDTVAQVHDKATIFRRQVEQDQQRSILKTICDLWIAAWFWRQPPKNAKPTDANWVQPLDGAIYRQLVSQLRGQQKTFPDTTFNDYMKALDSVIEEVRPFHWELEFPEVFYGTHGAVKANPGFDAVLGNPPWDIIMTNSLEFFSAYDPGFRELERVDALKRQSELQEDEQIQAVWESYTRDLDAQVDYINSSEVYLYQTVEIQGKKTRGHDNTYKLFLERALKLLHQGGLFGMIVQSGLYTDQGCTGLRELFLNHAQIDYLFCFENRREIFPIHRSFKFVLLGVCKVPTSNSFNAAFMLHDVDTLSAPEKHSVAVPTNLIRRFSPDTLSIMEFRSQIDIDLIDHIYDSWPLLGERKDDEWNIRLAREFNFTDDRSFFNQEGNGWPLYEGKMIHQYTHRYGEPQYWIESQQGQEELARREIQRVEEALDKLLIATYHTQKVSNAHERVTTFLRTHGRGPLTSHDVQIHADAPRLTYREVARGTDTRTMMSTILPSQTFQVYTVFYAIPLRFNAQKALMQLDNIRGSYSQSLPNPVMAYLCGMFNSFITDYILRFKVSMHVSMFYVYQLPVPRLTPDDPHCRAIAHRVARLVCVGPEFDELRRELLGDVNAHVATIQDERHRLQNEIDALVAHLYGLDEDDLRHILYAPYTFPLVKQGVKDGVMREFGRVEELLRGDG